MQGVRRARYARLSRSLVFLLTVGVASASADQPASDQCLAKPAAFPVRATIHWEMADHFGPGYDLNGDGLPDLPNTFEYVNPRTYEVRLAAVLDASGVAAIIVSSDWTIVGTEGAPSLRAGGLKPTVHLPEGTYVVSAVLRMAEGRSALARETICVKNLLVIALGDSLATGEGNPERPALWRDSHVFAHDGRLLPLGVAGGLLGVGLIGSFTGRFPHAVARPWLRRCARATRLLACLLVFTGLCDAFIGLKWVCCGRRDPTQTAVWADGGPEGDRPRVMPDGVLPPANATHVRAHRSTHSVPARFAMQLEASDPHTSVTFVCLAITGARTDDIFRADRSDQNRALGPGPVLPAQLHELFALLGPRTVDYLVLSIGINDSRSFEIFMDLMRRDVRYVDPLRLLVAYPTRRSWTNASVPEVDGLIDPAERATFIGMSRDAQRERIEADVKLIHEFDEIAGQGLNVVRAQLERTQRAIAADPRLNRADVYLLEYPDPTRVEGGRTGDAILDDLVPAFRINRRELDFFRERLLRPLNESRRELAGRYGWHYTEGVFEASREHGYAARDTWFVRVKESERLQGPRLWSLGYVLGNFPAGMLHPNQRGQEIIAKRLYQAVLDQRARRRSAETVNSSTRVTRCKFKEAAIDQMP
jgi:hypothetical protein